MPASEILTPEVIKETSTFYHFLVGFSQLKLRLSRASLQYPYRTTRNTIVLTLQIWELDHKEDWAPKNWCFWIVVLLCCRRLLRVPWTARRSIQSILRKSTLNTHWKDWSWSWSSNTLTTWCEEWSLEKTLLLGKVEGKRRKGCQRMRWLDCITDSMDMHLSKVRDSRWQRTLACCSSCGHMT